MQIHKQKSEKNYNKKRKKTAMQCNWIASSMKMFADDDSMDCCGLLTE